MVSPVLYSVGFVLSEDGKQLLLLQKQRPDWLRGQWIGIGGHVEDNETPLHAMAREAQEEANIQGVDWHLLEVQPRPASPGEPMGTAQIHIYVGVGDLMSAQALTDEPVAVFDWPQVLELNLSESTRAVIGQVHAYAKTLGRSKIQSAELFSPSNQTLPPRTRTPN